MKSSEDLKRCVRRICELLECEYGRKKHPAKTNPIDTLVLTILLSIDGVGQKTAACVLCFSFDKPCFPVDTHIYRICKRLGLGGNSRKEIASPIEETIAVDKLCAFHLNLIEHGRRICTARKPKCNDCVLKDYRYCYC